MAKQTITVSGILEDLSNGLTRTTKDKHYDAEKGCIKDKYGLTTSELNLIFQNEKLKGRKTKVEKENSFILVDDTDDKGRKLDNAENTSEETVEVSEEVEPVATTETVIVEEETQPQDAQELVENNPDDLW